MRALSFLAMAFTGMAAAPAFADETSECVQRELTAFGFYAGPIDGMIAEPTIAAAEAFDSAMKYPMPALADEAAAEWCAVLEGWAERRSGPGILQRDPLDYDGLGPMSNVEAGALPRGIHFGDEIPMELREAIVSDLTWLAGVGELKGADGLGALFGLPEPVTGALLVAWLLEHVSAITTPDAGCGETWIPTRPNGDAPFEMVPAQGHCDYFVDADHTMGAVTDHAHLAIEALATLRHVDEMRVVAPAGAWDFPTVIYLNLDNPVWTPVPNPSPTDFNHIDRLSALFHEAAHIAFNSRHVTCAESPDVNVWFDHRPHTVCDEGIADSAYLVSGIMQTVLAQNCCDVPTRIAAFRVATAELIGVTVPLQSPMTVPTNQTFAALHLAGRSFEAVPPEAYFQALSLMMETDLIRTGCPCGPPFDDIPGQIQAMWDLVEKQQQMGNTAGAWSLSELPEPSVSPGPEWAIVWLARASRAADGGYNVPLLWVVPCDQFEDAACGASGKQAG